jgi:hypothetical protein
VVALGTRGAARTRRFKSGTARRREWTSVSLSDQMHTPDTPEMGTGTGRGTDRKAARRPAAGAKVALRPTSEETTRRMMQC